MATPIEIVLLVSKHTVPWNYKFSKHVLPTSRSPPCITLPRMVEELSFLWHEPSRTSDVCLLCYRALIWQTCGRCGATFVLSPRPAEPLSRPHHAETCDTGGFSMAHGQLQRYGPSGSRTKRRATRARPKPKQKQWGLALEPTANGRPSSPVSPFALPATLTQPTTAPDAHRAITPHRHRIPPDTRPARPHLASVSQPALDRPTRG